MADEYIRRVEAEEAIEEYCCRRCKEYSEVEGGCVSHAQHCEHLSGEEILKPVKSADVQPVVHAYWIKLPKALNPNENPCKCSNCGHILSFMNGYPKSKYCDECGAKMDIVYEDDKIRAIKVTGWGDGTRNLTDEETNIYNNRLETEAKTIDEISL